MPTVSRKAVIARSYKEVGPKPLGAAEEFVDVAFPVAYMDASPWLTQSGRGLLDILDPRTLSFYSMGTRVGLIFFLRAFVPLNFFLVQNLTAAIPRGSPSVVTTRLACCRIPQTV